MKNILFIFALIFVVSCQKPEPREPVVKRSGHFLKKSAARNKAIQEAQEKTILSIIEKDSSKIYHISHEGFWYAYEQKNEEDSLKPGFGDLVNFNYNITDLHGNTIYSKEEIGTREYKMDQEDLFTGLRKGLKLMKEGETITFYFPSSVAFDYYGDNDRIGHNFPIRSTVTLNSIKVNKQKSEN